MNFKGHQIVAVKRTLETVMTGYDNTPCDVEELVLYSRGSNP